MKGKCTQVCPRFEPWPFPMMIPVTLSASTIVLCINFIQKPLKKYLKKEKLRTLFCDNNNKMKNKHPCIHTTIYIYVSVFIFI